MYPRRPITSDVYQPSRGRLISRDAIRPQTTRPQPLGASSGVKAQALALWPRRPASSSSFASMLSTRPSTRSGLMQEMWDEFEARALGPTLHADSNRLRSVEDVKGYSEGSRQEVGGEDDVHGWEEEVQACMDNDPLQAGREGRGEQSSRITRIQEELSCDAVKVLGLQSLKQLDLRDLVVHGYKAGAASRYARGLG
eukprot:404322-Hanusia_phi.AAC.2